MFLLLNKFFSPDDSSSSGAISTVPAVGDKGDDIKFLGLDDDTETIDLKEPKIGDKTIPKTTVKESKSTKSNEKNDDIEELDEKLSEDDEEPDELEELVKDLDEEDPTDEQLDVVTPVRRREILKKYPQLFKDFPYLEKAYYREQQFTELLPTIADAKNAVQKSETLDRFESDLMGGNTETVLKAVRDTDPNSFYKIVDDYLPTLARIDEKAYHHVLSNTIKHTIISMVQEAKRSKNESLQAAAQVLNQFAFGSSEFTPPNKLTKEQAQSDPRINELEIKQREFTKQQFESTRGDLNSKLNNSLQATIEANIDPRNSMTDYVKKNAVREANEQLGQLLTQDIRFKGIIDRLWENAFKHSFNRDSIDKIKSAYLSKAKTLLPSVIKKSRIDALKGMGKRVTESIDESDNSTDNKSSKTSSSKPRSQNSGKPDSKVPKGMRTIDFLMQD